MKLKKRPIFLEITKNSFFAIILILTIYTVSQLVVFWIFIDKHEIDLVKSRYQEIINLSNSINIEFSEKGFIEYLERLDYNENDEYIEFIRQMNYTINHLQKYGNILILIMQIKIFI